MLALLLQGMWGEGGPGTSGGSVSRSGPLHRPEAQVMAADALQLVSRLVTCSCLSEKGTSADLALHLTVLINYS